MGAEEFPLSLLEPYAFAALANAWRLHCPQEELKGLVARGDPAGLADMEAFLHHGGPFSCSQGLHDPAESPAPLHDGPYGGGASSPGLRGGLQCPPPALQGSLGSHDSPQLQLASPQGLMHEDPRGPAKPLEAQSLGLHDSAASLLDLGELDKSMGHMQALIIREVVKDIEVACSLLHVPADPESWSCRHVDKWLAWSVHQYGLGPLCLDFLRMDGASLCLLSEEDFRLRASRAGELLHAHLDVWRSVCVLGVQCGPGV
ncbi:SAM pointed domain-containing Ets transcription factor-like [Petromyzon marinus]|uniref:SAM pointed domain-containing Ets transcription factor-like n=1 Tax=Petromyzon marinus TaxID=7757 RepID=UPI003F6F0910